ncbi:MAG: XkdX family protein [Lachnospiraceae bacterium]|nr:XkdX family protein [Bacteroides fragilis]MCM1219017.1 XkdX family protein [Lachnospiraceae bacterium]
MEYSKNFKKVKQYYDLKLWNIEKVRSAVGKWINKSEYEEITGRSY